MEEKVKFIFKWLGIMFILSVITFLIVRFIPVSPIDMLLQHYNLPLTEENRKLLTSYYKLDQSLFKQYIVWIKDFLKGNWGISFITKLPVNYWAKFIIFINNTFIFPWIFSSYK